MPKRPKRSSRSSRSTEVSPLTLVADGSWSTKSSTDINRLSSSSGPSRANSPNAWNSSSRKVTPACAIRPATGTTAWQMRRNLGSRAVSVRDPRGRLHRVCSTDAHLVGAGEHGDDAGRGRVVAIGERVEEAKVGRVEVAGEVHDRVGGAVTHLAGERGLGARRELGGDRGEPRRVDEAHRSKCRRRPLDHDALERLGRQLAE